MVASQIYGATISCQEIFLTAEILNMTVKFCLKLKDAVIGQNSVDYFEVSWQEELDTQELADRFGAWLKDQNFIERKLPDLKNAAYCQLSIDPS
jgi:hypothetical protein